MKIILLLITGFCLISCSSAPKRKQVVAQDVAKNFELSDDLLQKFSTENVDKKITSKSVKKKTRRKQKNPKKSSKKKRHNKNKKGRVKHPHPEKIGNKTEAIRKDYPSKFRKFDQLSKAIWDSYRENIYIGEQATYKMKYLGATAGYITLSVAPLTSLAGVEVYHFSAEVKTANYYSFIYWLNDSLHSYVKRDGFLPLKYILAQREKKQDIDDLQLFDHEKLQTIFLYRKLKKGKETKKKKIADIPFYFQDSFSSLYFVRGLRLEVGKVYQYPIVNKAKYWLLKMRVVKKEKIEIMDKDVWAYKIAAETKFPGVLKKTGDIFFWYSTDKDQRLLKFKGKVKIGALYGELVKFKAGKRLEAR